MDTSFVLLSTMSPKVNKTNKKVAHNRVPTKLALKRNIRRSSLANNLSFTMNNNSVLLAEGSTTETTDSCSSHSSNVVNRTPIVISDTENEFEDSALAKPSRFGNENRRSSDYVLSAPKFSAINEWVNRVNSETATNGSKSSTVLTPSNKMNKYDDLSPDTIEGSDCSDEEYKASQELLDELYGNKWRKTKDTVLPKSEPRKKRINVINRIFPKTERKLKQKRSITHKNPYLASEKEIGCNTPRQIKTASESPWIKRLGGLCDSDSSDQSLSEVLNNLTVQPRIRLSSTNKYLTGSEKDVSPKKTFDQLQRKENFNGLSKEGQKNCINTNEKTKHFNVSVNSDKENVNNFSSTVRKKIFSSDSSETSHDGFDNFDVSNESLEARIRRKLFVNQKNDASILVKEKIDDSKHLNVGNEGKLVHRKLHTQTNKKTLGEIKPDSKSSDNFENSNQTLEDLLKKTLLLYKINNPSIFVEKKADDQKPTIGKHITTGKTKDVNKTSGKVNIPRKTKGKNDVLKKKPLTVVEPNAAIVNKGTILTDLPYDSEKGVHKSFLASLSRTVKVSECDPSARIFRNNFKTYRNELTKKLFKLFNEKVFDGAIPDSSPVEWSPRMTKTGGLCHSSKITRRTGLVERKIRIVLSSKVVDSADRLRDVLIHEMCHAATWIVNEIKDAHGAYWKAWADKACKTFPELPPVTVCHRYEISTKYTYKCVGCGYSIGRHSKSLDVERKRCGHCYGKFEVFINKTSKSGETRSVAVTPKKQPTPFALFVKENYAEFKTPQLNHAQVMRVLGQKFNELQVTVCK